MPDPASHREAARQAKPCPDHWGLTNLKPRPGLALFHSIECDACLDAVAAALTPEPSGSGVGFASEPAKEIASEILDCFTGTVDRDATEVWAHATIAKVEEWKDRLSRSVISPAEIERVVALVLRYYEPFDANIHKPELPQVARWVAARLGEAR